MADNHQAIILFSLGRSASHFIAKTLVSGQDPTRVEYSEYNFGGNILMIMDKTAKADVSSDSFPVDEYEKVWKAEAEAAITTMRVVHQTTSKGMRAVLKEHVKFALRPDLHYVRHTWQLDPAVGVSANPTLDPLKLDFGRVNVSERELIPAEWLASPSTNVTVLPDAFLHNILPVFLIRDPSLFLPSFVRIWDGNSSLERHLSVPTLLPTRKLFEWYSAQDPRYTGHAKPLIVDAADAIRSSKFRAALASAVGLDPDKVVDSWSAASGEEKSTWHAMKLKMTKTLADSTGPDLSKADSVSAKEAREKWIAEFGEENANVLQRRVDEETEHWNYLYSRRYVVEP